MFADSTATQAVPRQVNPMPAGTEHANIHSVEETPPRQPIAALSSAGEIRSVEAASDQDRGEAPRLRSQAERDLLRVLRGGA